MSGMHARSSWLPPIDGRYVDGRSVIEITADLATGWTRKTKTFGYSEEIKLDSLGDYSIRIKLTVLPRPCGFRQEAGSFPDDAEGSGDDRGINYTVLKSLLTVRVRLLDAANHLNYDLPWRILSTRKLGIYWIQDPIAKRGSTHFELQLLTVINPPPRAKPQDVRDWECRFCPGGLPSLGKRR